MSLRTQVPRKNVMQRNQQIGGQDILPGLQRDPHFEVEMLSMVLQKRTDLFGMLHKENQVLMDEMYRKISTQREKAVWDGRAGQLQGVPCGYFPGGVLVRGRGLN